MRNRTAVGAIVTLSDARGTIKGHVPLASLRVTTAAEESA